MLYLKHSYIHRECKTYKIVGAGECTCDSASGFIYTCQLMSPLVISCKQCESAKFKTRIKLKFSRFNS